MHHQKIIARAGITLALLLTLSTGWTQSVKSVKVTELEELIKNSKHPLLINFWATWCVPCIEELPHFLSVSKEFASDSLQLLLVSLDMEDDYPAKIQSFIQKRKIDATVWWLNESNADYFCSRIDPKWSGAIPASLFVNNARGYRKFEEKQLSETELRDRIAQLLGN